MQRGVVADRTTLPIVSHVLAATRGNPPLSEPYADAAPTALWRSLDHEPGEHVPLHVHLLTNSAIQVVHAAAVAFPASVNVQYCAEQFLVGLIPTTRTEVDVLAGHLGGPHIFLEAMMSLVQCMCDVQSRRFERIRWGAVGSLALFGFSDTLLTRCPAAIPIACQIMGACGGERDDDECGDAAGFLWALHHYATPDGRNRMAPFIPTIAASLKSAWAWRPDIEQHLGVLKDELGLP